jgi:hypothetical protein
MQEIMRTMIAILFLWSFVAPGSVRADDHLVSSADVRSHLSSATAAADRERATLDRLLAAPAARSAAARLGTSASHLRAAVSTLDDAEARDLAARAAALGLDPASGEDWDTNDILTVFLVVAIVILVLDAV